MRRNAQNGTLSLAYHHTFAYLHFLHPYIDSTHSHRPQLTRGTTSPALTPPTTRQRTSFGRFRHAKPTFFPFLHPSPPIPLSPSPR